MTRLAAAARRSVAAVSNKRHATSGTAITVDEQSSALLPSSTHAYSRYRDPDRHLSDDSDRRRALNELKRKFAGVHSASGRARRVEEDGSDLYGEEATPQEIERKSRRQMEASWDAKQDTCDPPASSISDSKATQPGQKQDQRPLAILFPGTASQYSGMGNFLMKKHQTARRVWEEAEHALAGFERWRKDLDLPADPALAQLELREWPAWMKEREPDQLRKIVFGGDQLQLTKSSNAQPAILITSIAFLRTLEEEYNVPVSRYASFFAGHSSGEYAACVAAGVMSFAEAVWLTVSSLLIQRWR